MKSSLCNICGANYEYVNGKWRCPACGAYMPEELSNEEVTLLYSASQKLRLADFDGAEEAYRDITRNYPQNSDGFWGLVCARYGIKYEQDYDGKMIPTCYSASYNSFLEDKDYKRAIDLASDDNKGHYRHMADIIERVRKDWVEKASKEPPYDIFISYKDTDDGKRTDDSLEANDLYLHLKELGYNVFFSRESLKGKTGEKYEPYIFNALNTAHVMIVYGSNPEYLEATWVRNEWMRFYKRIKNGEKQQNALIVVYKDFNPGKLPRILSKVQALDRDSLTFTSDLEAYLTRVIKAATVSLPKIERIQVKDRSHGVSAAPLETIEVQEINSKNKRNQAYESAEKREIGSFSVPKLTANAERSLNVAEGYLHGKQFGDAKRHFEEFLTNNKDNGRALLGKLLCETECVDIDQLTNLHPQELSNLELLSKVLEFSEKSVAENVLRAVCSLISKAVESFEYSIVSDLFGQVCAFETADVRNIREKLFELSKDIVNNYPDIASGIVDNVLLYESQQEEFIEKLYVFSEKVFSLRNYELAEKYITKLEEYSSSSLKTQYLKIRLRYRSHDEQIFDILNSNEAYDFFDEVLNVLDSDSANKFLKSCSDYVRENAARKQYDVALIWLKKCAKYKYDDRTAFLEKIIGTCQKNASVDCSELFDCALSYYSDGSVEVFSKNVFDFANAFHKKNLFDDAKKYYLKYREYNRNNDVLWNILCTELQCFDNKNMSERIAELGNFDSLDDLISFQSNNNDKCAVLEILIDACLNSPAIAQNDDKIFPVFERIISYVPEECNDFLIPKLMSFASLCQINARFEKAERYFGMVIGLDQENHQAYWGLLQVKLNCKNDGELVESEEPIGEIQEFSNALLSSSNNQSALTHYITIQTNQRKRIEEKAEQREKLRKKKKKIRITCIVIACIVFLASCAAAGLIFYKRQSGLVYSYSSDVGGYTVKGGLFYSAQGSVEIPDTYDGKPVIAIADNTFENETGLTEIIIPYSIESIGNRAFANTALKTITISDNVDYIGSGAFAGCMWLETVFVGNRMELPSEWDENWNENCNANIEYALIVTLEKDSGKEKGLVVYGKEFSLTIPADKAGYIFDGWYRGNDRITDENGNSLSAWNYEKGGSLSAHYIATENTLRFDANGGEGEMPDQIIATDETDVLNLNRFTCPGYHFAGWSTEKDGEAVYEDAAGYLMGIQSIYTLYAVWEPNVNTVHFDANGGEGEMEDQKIACNATAELNANTFTRTGYKFEGWAEAKSAEKVFDNQNMYEMGIESEYTLYAVWKPIEYIITYNLSGGTGSDNPTTYTIETETFTLINPTRAGYTFAGWNDNNKKTSVPKGSTGAKTFVAKWTANTNTLHFDPNGGTGTMADQKIKTDASAGLNPNTFERTGYYFAGWATTKSGAKLYDNKGQYTMGASDTTLYAIWTPIPYSITYELDGGSTNNPLVYFISSNDIILSDPIKPGYTFLGWSGTGISGTSKNVIISTGSFGNRTYTANWKKNTNTLHFDANGGQGAMEDMKISTAATVTLNENNFTRFGYTFAGWATLKNGTKLYDDKCQYTMGTSNTTLYAVWAPIPYSITYELDGGSTNNSTVYYINSDDITLSDPVKPGYTFLGWSGTGISGTSKNVIISTGSYGDRTYTANWTANTHTLHFDANGGQGAMEDMEISTSATVTLNENKFTRFGYTFAGWATTKNGTKLYDDKCQYTMGTSDTTLYAVWTLLSPGLLYSRSGNNECYVSIGSCTNSDIVIPEVSPDGYKVVGISNYAFYECSSLTSVTIPDSVTSIGDYAFSGCKKLTSIIIPDGVVSIGSSAFSDCSSLTSITIPDSVMSIGAYAFGWCTRLTDIYYAGTEAEWAATSKGNGWDYNTNFTVHCLRVDLGRLAFTSNGDGTCYVSGIGTYKETDLVIPSVSPAGYKVVAIGDDAFNGCTNLTSVTVPDGVTSIGLWCVSQLHKH